MERADQSKLAFAGFSMGASEVVYAQARHPTAAQAAVIVSGSILVPMANLIQWNCNCKPLAGGTCCSGTDVGLCGTGAAVGLTWRAVAPVPEL